MESLGSFACCALFVWHRDLMRRSAYFRRRQSDGKFAYVVDSLPLVNHATPLNVDSRWFRSFFYVHNKQRALQSVSAYCGQSLVPFFFFMSTISRERCSLSPLIVDSRFFATTRLIMDIFLRVTKTRQKECPH